MPDLLTLTLNPALDLSTAAERVVAGPKLRLDAPVEEPGGGGVNVARAVLALGGRPRALVALGGRTGERLAQMLRDAGLDLAVFAVPGETRQNLAVTDRSDGRQYRLQMPGPRWDAGLVEGFVQAVVTQAIGVVVLSGSLPPGVSADFAQRLAARLAGRSRLVVDTSGEALHQLVRAPQAGAQPLVLRMDQAESEDLAGHPLPDIAASLHFAQGLLAQGVAECIVLARGAEGSVLVADGLALHCRPPQVPVVSKIGAGDSFTGAFALALAHDQGWEAALRKGTAAAAAAVMTPGSALCRAEDCAALEPMCRMTPLA